MKTAEPSSAHAAAHQTTALAAAVSLRAAATGSSYYLALDKSDRSSYFPKIEAKYGQPMRYWFGVMKEIADRKYPEQIAFLKEEHGFSQAHANALVMYSRGSKSSKRFDNLSGFLEKHDAVKQKTVRKVFKVIQSKYPKLELVIAWNQPMLKLGNEYIFGLSISKNHLTLAPFRSEVLDEMSKELEGYKRNKKTFIVPADWKVDEKLLHKLIRLTLKQVKESKA